MRQHDSSPAQQGTHIRTPNARAHLPRQNNSPRLNFTGCSNGPWRVGELQTHERHPSPCASWVCCNTAAARGAGCCSECLLLGRGSPAGVSLVWQPLSSPFLHWPRENTHTLPPVTDDTTVKITGGVTPDAPTSPRASPGRWPQAQGVGRRGLHFWVSVLEILHLKHTRSSRTRPPRRHLPNDRDKAVRLPGPSSPHDFLKGNSECFFAPVKTVLGVEQERAEDKR